MNDFLIFLYQLLHGIQDDPLWDDVYVTSGWTLIVITIIILIFYYHILNRFFIKWHCLRHWFLFMLINSILITIITNLIAYNILEPIEYSTEFLTFAVVNFFYAAIFYALFSLVFCFGSPNAKYTPYKFYHKNRKQVKWWQIFSFSLLVEQEQEFFAL